MSGRRVLVTGATGAVGPAVVRALTAEGWRVRVFAKPGDQSAPIDPRVEICTGDITDAAALCHAAAGVEAVVHMAALLHETGQRSLPSEYRRVNVGGTETTLAAASQAGARRVVLLSTIAVYGDLGGGVADEDTPARPDTPYAETKLAAERLVLAATDASGQPAGVVLRAGAVYGPRVRGNYRRLVLALARGRFVPVGDGRNRRTLVFDDDLARAVVLALEHPRAPATVFNVTDGQFHRVNTVVAAICQALQRRPPRLFVPVPLAMAGCRLAEIAAGLMRREPPVRSAALRKYAEDVAVSGERIIRDLGFRARHDLVSGWQAAVDGLKAAGDL